MNGTENVSKRQDGSERDNQAGDDGRCGGVPAPSGDTATHGGLVGPLSPYLESIRKTVFRETSEERSKIVVCPCRCKSFFCPRCCLAEGLKLRKCLVKVLKGFKDLQMWTLTIDPNLFASPLLSFLHVREKRAISEFVRWLFDRGCLHSRKYFYVIEWQKNGWPHYHILLDTSNIPFEVACQAWNRSRPKSADPSTVRFGLGIIKFSMPRFANVVHAARYATKYLLKPPEGGYPDWVRHFTGHIKKYGTSRGFWKPTEAAVGEQESLPALPKRVSSKKRKRSKQTKTIEERTKSCGIAAVVLEERHDPNKDGSKSPIYRYLGGSAFPFPELQKEFGEPEASTKSFEIPRTKMNFVMGTETPGRRETWQLDQVQDSDPEYSKSEEEN